VKVALERFEALFGVALIALTLIDEVLV